MQLPALTTTEARKNNFTLLVALDSNGRAKGDFYMDDGESSGYERVNEISYIVLHNLYTIIFSFTFVEYSCSGKILNAKASGPVRITNNGLSTIISIHRATVGLCLLWTQ